MKITLSTADQVDSYLYALGGLADNEHDKGCDEAFCNCTLDILIEKLQELKDQTPCGLELDFYERFTLYAAADVFGESADEICETPGTEATLAAIAKELNPDHKETPDGEEEESRQAEGSVPPG